MYTRGMESNLLQPPFTWDLESGSESMYSRGLDSNVLHPSALGAWRTMYSSPPTLGAWRACTLAPLHQGLVLQPLHPGLGEHVLQPPCTRDLYSSPGLGEHVLQPPCTRDLYSSPYTRGLESMYSSPPAPGTCTPAPTPGTWRACTPAPLHCGQSSLLLSLDNWSDCQGLLIEFADLCIWFTETEVIPRGLSSPVNIKLMVLSLLSLSSTGLLILSQL